MSTSWAVTDSIDSIIGGIGVFVSEPSFRLPIIVMVFAIIFAVYLLTRWKNG